MANDETTDARERTKRQTRRCVEKRNVDNEKTRARENQTTSREEEDLATVARDEETTVAKDEETTVARGTRRRQTREGPGDDRRERDEETADARGTRRQTRVGRRDD